MTVVEIADFQRTRTIREEASPQMSATRSPNHADVDELVAAAAEALKALNEISGAELAVESVASSDFDPRVPVIARSNSHIASDAAQRLMKALAAFEHPNRLFR
jgi:hypothetical protein